MPLKIGLDLADALRLAAEGLAGVEKGVVIDLLERLQLHAEAFAVGEQSLVMIGDPPGAGVKVEPFVELALLGGPTQLRDFIPTAYRPVRSEERRVGQE